MAFRFPKIYPITDKTLSGLSHAEQVARLIDGGATLIQLRDKESPPSEFLKEAEVALQLARRHNVRLIINDRVDIAMALDADGVHLGQADLPADAARRLLRPGSLIGLSTHNTSQVQDARRLPVDYVAFGPVFSTSSKADHEPMVGLDQLSQAKLIVGELPLVAIGGINFEGVRQAFEAGADSVALISSLLSEPSKITENMSKFLRQAP